MKTLEQITDALKQQYPVIKVGSDEVGYSELDATDYEATIAEWAKNYPPEPKTAQQLEAAKAQAATDKAALLAKLGITADEAKLLLS